MVLGVAQNGAYSKRYGSIAKEHDKATRALKSTAEDAEQQRLQQMKEESQRRVRKIRAKEEKLKQEEEERRQKALEERRQRMHTQIPSSHNSTMSRKRRQRRRPSNESLKRPKSVSSSRQPSARTIRSNNYNGNANYTNNYNSSSSNSRLEYAISDDGDGDGDGDDDQGSNWWDPDYSAQQKQQQPERNTDDILEQALNAVRHYQEQQQEFMLHPSMEGYSTNRQQPHQERKLKQTSSAFDTHMALHHARKQRKREIQEEEERERRMRIGRRYGVLPQANVKDPSRWWEGEEAEHGEDEEDIGFDSGDESNSSIRSNNHKNYGSNSGSDDSLGGSDNDENDQESSTRVRRTKEKKKEQDQTDEKAEWSDDSIGEGDNAIGSSHVSTSTQDPPALLLRRQSASFHQSEIVNSRRNSIDSKESALLQKYGFINHQQHQQHQQQSPPQRTPHPPQASQGYKRASLPSNHQQQRVPTANDDDVASIPRSSHNMDILNDYNAYDSEEDDREDTDPIMVYSHNKPSHVGDPSMESRQRWQKSSKRNSDANFNDANGRSDDDTSFHHLSRKQKASNQKRGEYRQRSSSHPSTSIEIPPKKVLKTKPSFTDGSVNSHVLQDPRLKHGVPRYVTSFDQLDAAKAQQQAQRRNGSTGEVEPVHQKTKIAAPHSRESSSERGRVSMRRQTSNPIPHEDRGKYHTRRVVHRKRSSKAQGMTDINGSSFHQEGASVARPSLKRGVHHHQQQQQRSSQFGDYEGDMQSERKTSSVSGGRNSSQQRMSSIGRQRSNSTKGRGRDRGDSVNSQIMVNEGMWLASRPRNRSSGLHAGVVSPPDHQHVMDNIDMGRLQSAVEEKASEDDNNPLNISLESFLEMERISEGDIRTPLSTKGKSSFQKHDRSSISPSKKSVLKSTRGWDQARGERKHKIKSGQNNDDNDDAISNDSSNSDEGPRDVLAAEEKMVTEHLEQLDKRLELLEKRQGEDEVESGNSLKKRGGLKKGHPASAPGQNMMPKPPKAPRSQSARLRSKQYSARIHQHQLQHRSAKATGDTSALNSEVKESSKMEINGCDDAMKAMTLANAMPVKQKKFRRYYKPTSYSEIHGNE